MKERSRIMPTYRTSTIYTFCILLSFFLCFCCLQFLRLSCIRFIRILPLLQWWFVFILILAWIFTWTNFVKTVGSLGTSHRTFGTVWSFLSIWAGSTTFFFFTSCCVFSLVIEFQSTLCLVLVWIFWNCCVTSRDSVFGPFELGMVFMPGTNYSHTSKPRTKVEEKQERKKRRINETCEKKKKRNDDERRAKKRLPEEHLESSCDLVSAV